jgi:WD40 repeat protein
MSSPTGEPLALHTPDGSTRLHIWDMRAKALPSIPQVLGENLMDKAGVIFSPEGRWIAAISPMSDDANFVNLWDFSTPSPTHYVVRHEGGILASPVFSPDGRWLATGGWDDGTVRLWDLKAPDPTANPKVLAKHGRPLRSLAFSQDGHRLVTGANESSALVWDLSKVDSASDPIRLEGGGGIVNTVAISHDGRYVVTGSWEPDHAARIWDLSSPLSSSNPIKLTFKDRLDEVAISPDNRWVAAGSWDQTTQLLDMKKPGSKPFLLHGHTARTLAVGFSPDSKWLATGNEDRTVRLWNLEQADPSTDSVVLNQPYRVGSVSFSHNGQWLVVGSSDYRTNPFSHDDSRFASSNTETRLYHLQLGDLIDLACRTAGRNFTEKEWSKSNGKACTNLPDT